MRKEVMMAYYSYKNVITKAGAINFMYMYFPGGPWPYGNTLTWSGAAPGGLVLDNGGLNILEDYNWIKAHVNTERRIMTLSNGAYMTIKWSTDFNRPSIGLYLSNGTNLVSDGYHVFSHSSLGLNRNTEFMFLVLGYDSDGNKTINIYSKTEGQYCLELDADYGNDKQILAWTTNARFDVLDPYGTLPDNENPGIGYGPYDYTSETETPPQLPSLSAAQVGFVSLWNPTQAEMKDLANYLWTGTFDLTNFKKLFTDPMECVLSVGIIPITPARENAKREIVFGGSSHSGVNAYAVTEQFYIVDMGTLHITGMSQGALDYSPYAKASIYLPYCGTYALDVDEIMDSDISLEYHIDVYTGACVAYLTIDGHLNSDGKNVNAIMYQFTGNVLASIPITGNDHSQFIQSMLFMGAAAAATVATSGAGAGATAGAGADLGAETAATGFNKALAGSAVNTVMSMKPNVLHSGNLSTTAGMLGGQNPFITMTWSNLCRPEEEYKLVGLPLHKSGTLSDFEGFTIVSACHLDNILCTDAELQMIEQALAKGVIL